MIEKIWSLNEKDQLKIWVFLWRWWTARKKANAGQRITESEVCHSAAYHLMEFEKLKEDRKESFKLNKEECWRPPLGDIYKINIDASFQADLKKRRLGLYYLK